MVDQIRLPLLDANDKIPSHFLPPAGDALPTPTTDGDVLGLVAGEPAWVAPPSGLPTTGTNGKVLTVVDGEPEWADLPAPPVFTLPLDVPVLRRRTSGGTGAWESENRDDPARVIIWYGIDPSPTAFAEDQDIRMVPVD